MVIGILIALQINNWNKDRKQRIDEIGLLRDLKTDLEIKTKEFQEAYAINEKLNENTIRFIISQVNHQEVTFDVNEVLYFADHYPLSTQINSLEVALEGNTINIIRSDSLVTMLRKLKTNLVSLEIDEAFVTEIWTSSFLPFLEESGLSAHRFALIHNGIEPDREMLKGIDMKVFANEASAIASIQAQWLKKQKVIIEDMSHVIRIVQLELER